MGVVKIDLGDHAAKLLVTLGELSVLELFTARRQHGINVVERSICANCTEEQKDLVSDLDFVV